MAEDQCQEPERWDGPCEFCGETVKGTPYLATGLFAVVSDEGDGIFFCPDDDEPPQDHESWESVPLLRCIHLACLPNYLDGVLADTAHRRRLGEMEGG